MGLEGSTNRVVGVEIAEDGLSRRRRHGTNDLTDIVSSWSLHDILNENLYYDQVETIPDTFQSVPHYLGSYVYPLLEETRASLCSSLEDISLLPFTEVIEFMECTGSRNSYAVKAGRWSNESNSHGTETYKTLPGDILILTDAKPTTVPDLERFARRWAFALVRMIGKDDEEDEATSSTNFEVETLLDLEVNNSWKPMHAIFLINIVTNRRIWNVLHMSRNLDILKEVLFTDVVADKVSNLCITKGNGSASESLDKRLSHDLNESQKKAVGACLRKLHCENKPSFELIWGPPGTGKTKTIATLLFTLLKRKHRTIVCAPTNVAIKEVASCVLKLLKQSDSGISTETGSFLCYFDMLIFGNKERLKVDSDIEEIYMEHRVECFSKFTSLTSMIGTLDKCVRQYHILLEKEHTKRSKPESDDDGSECGSSELKSFLEFFRDRFKATVQPLRRCLYIFCTHISRTNFQNITSLLNLLDTFETLLCGEKLDSEVMEITLSRDELLKYDADIVNGLHRRLFRGQFAGNVVDFVYIDEVQDLTLRQISLFKYICGNFDGGFVFCGDTAQTIARGIDFRFEDIRSLFYKEFLIDSMDGPDKRMEKGCLSKIFHLSQNFRTHSGILKLAQSVVDLLYHFFPLTIDALGPETSFICGEAPILLESENDESAILSIFGNRDFSGNFVGFGAEQVILVRDDHSRNEVSNLVRGQALVLTIVECKGLEFQDVLLYNFFGTSPLKSQWRVIYGYMKEQALLDNSPQWSSPSFDDAKHNILCSELKQLYVAITRTRQRLWICENALEFSKPILDYWKKKCLIQVRLVDHALAEAMQVSSTPEEWKSQGFKVCCFSVFSLLVVSSSRNCYFRLIWSQHDL
ncbi:uncharacterized protein LOC104453602 [Eucalyptus grandis]|uniref:uncharacterized protein LOC104453602 n=1 Tax=Eucalyptus grandis TaxID=71139 RepID=UPI00192EA9C9|nr:uncharacterized protein LOC104453602 [Eucalyptus grandis]